MFGVRAGLVSWQNVPKSYCGAAFHQSLNQVLVMIVIWILDWFHIRVSWQSLVNLIGRKTQMYHFCLCPHKTVLRHITGFQVWFDGDVNATVFKQGNCYSSVPPVVSLHFPSLVHGKNGAKTFGERVAVGVKK